MPTLECLDERSQQILARIELMDRKITESFRDFRFAIEERNKLMDERIEKVEADILQIKLQHAEESGKKSMIIWLGGLALTTIASILGAVGNAIYNWWVKIN